MEENKFERQVQQKMEDLKIHPSDTVWKKIEVRLEKKKPSNTGLVLAILCFFFLLTGGYLLWNTGSHSIKKENNSEKANPAKNTNQISAKESKTSEATPDAIPGATNQKNDVVANAGTKKEVNKNLSQRHEYSTGRRVIKINPGAKSTIVSSGQQEVKDAISENTGTKGGKTPDGEIQPGDEKIKAEIKAPAYDKSNEDSLSKPSLQDEKPKVKDTLQPILSSPVTAKHSRKNKWRPGILVSGGISGVGNNFLGLVNSAPYDYLNSPNSNGSPATSYGATPSGIRSAFGFIAGVFAERDISAKTALVAGINFKTFNTSNKVGARNDTTGMYNSRNVASRHSNYYNFIELPVSIKVRIGRSKNMPLYWQGGVVVSELLNSNALQFNPNTGSYYSDNSIFNKTQIGLNAAFSISLFSRQKNSVLIGPYFYYSASRLANEGLYNKKHFVFTALRAEIIFGK